MRFLLFFIPILMNGCGTIATAVVRYPSYLTPEIIGPRKYLLFNQDELKGSGSLKGSAIIGDTH